MTELKDLKVGDEVTVTLTGKVVEKEEASGALDAYVNVDFSKSSDWVGIDEADIREGNVTIKRAPRPLPTEFGVYVPSTNKDFAHWSVIYKLDSDGWRYSDGENHVSGGAALERARNAHETLGGLVHLVPEQ